MVFFFPQDVLLNQAMSWDTGPSYGCIISRWKISATAPSISLMNHKHVPSAYGHVYYISPSTCPLKNPIMKSFSISHQYPIFIFPMI
jgi:hypothetical protein